MGLAFLVPTTTGVFRAPLVLSFCNGPIGMIPSIPGIVILLLPLALLAENASQVLDARLLTPLSSHSPPGTPFTLRVNGARDSRAVPSLAPGTLIGGRVRKSSSLGLGLRRERARLELDFTGCQSDKGDTIDCTVDMVAIDNAREAIFPDNQVRGVIAASHPHSWLNGIWFRPDGTLPHRAALGLTGASGKLHEGLAPAPILGAIVIGLRLIFFRLPNTEIELPSGTDMLVRVQTPVTSTSRMDWPMPEGLDEDLRATLMTTPVAVTKPKGKAAADIINFAFLSTEERLVKSFEAAGWVAAEPLTPKTFLRTYAAVSAMKAYPQAPVSPIFYEGRLPDFVFQKSFNSLAKRHHIRVWRAGPRLWLGAATHDVSVAFLWKSMSFTHLIDPLIDREREKILNDLAAANCMQGLALLPRPGVAADKPAPEQAVTDGAMAVVSLRECSPGGPEARPTRPRQSLARKAVRRVVLETRHYLTRGSAYYLSYQMVRRARLSWRNEFSRQPGEQPQSAGEPRGDRSGEGASRSDPAGDGTAVGLADGPTCGAVEDE